MTWGLHKVEQVPWAYCVDVRYWAGSSVLTLLDQTTDRSIEFAPSGGTGGEEEAARKTEYLD